MTTKMTALHRAWKDTRTQFGFDPSTRGRLVVAALVWIVAAVLVRVFSPGELASQLRWAVAGIVAAVIVFLPVFGLNLLSAPARIERDGRIAAEQRVSELEATLQTHPRVETEIESSRGDSLLRVRNLGAPGLFHAHLRILGSTVGGASPGESHRLWWGRAHDLAAKIVTGGDDYLLLAHRSFGGEMVEVNLYCYDDDFRQPRQFWIRGHAIGQDIEPIAEFEVTITSEPEIGGGPITRRLRFGAMRGLEEIEDHGGSLNG